MMVKDLQSVYAEITEEENNLEELQVRMKKWLVKLQVDVAVELSWKLALTRVTSLRDEKSFLLDVLRSLYQNLGDTVHAVGASKTEVHQVLSVREHIVEKRSQVKAVEEQLEAAALELADRGTSLAQQDPSGWDEARARAHREYEAFCVLDESLREDKTYILDVLKILRRMDETLETQDRTQ
eukprot:contig_16598_g4040